MSKKHLLRIAALELALARAAEAGPAGAALATPAPATQEEMVSLAISKLREARDLLTAADAPRALERVRSALKSAEGAERNAGYRRIRSDRAAQQLGA